jgi:MFS family permease
MAACDLCHMFSRNSDFNAWLLVAVMFMALGVTFTGRASLPILMTSWESDFGWTRTFMSAGGSIILIVMAISAPVVGNLLDRYGPRFIVGPGLIVSGLSIGFMGLLDGKLAFLLLFCTTAAIGYGVVSIPIAAATIARKFDKNRGFASSLGMAGVGGGQAIFLPMIAWLISVYGWRVALIIFGFGLIATGCFSIICLDNEIKASETPGEAGNRSKHFSGKLRFILTNKIFWLLGLAYIICGFTTAGIVKVHFVPFVNLICGFSLNESALAYGVLALFDAVGMVLAGYLSDRVNRPMLLGMIYFFRALTFLILFFIPTEFWILILFAVAFGTLDFATVPLNAGLVADHLGLSTMGLTMGLMFAGHSIGGALGSFFGGAAYDFAASYDGVWLAGLGLAFVAAVLAWFVPESRKSESHLHSDRH